ncbi:hypothetical protein ACERII_21780 [Evansella sp. AB-rgal1]|uniref:hypothetical protein n=1 Tax=Evansella sp. AB-rgal1 TaxID=3242696 RepID=UPI00359E927F
MFHRLQEEQVAKLKDVAYERLYPGSIYIFLWGVLFASSAVTAITSFAFNYSIYINASYWETVITTNYVLLAIQAIGTLLFSIRKIMFKFQRIQMIFVSILSLKLSLEFYQIFYLIREDRGLPSMLDTGVLVIIAGGLIYLLFSTIRAVKRVKQGHLRSGGEGLYQFQHSKGYVSLPIIFAFSVLGAMLARANVETAIGEVAQVLLFLLAMILIQYGIAMAWPEFLLVTYCKFRFSSFIVPEEKINQSKRHRETKKVRTKDSYPLTYWVTKPFTVLRSRAELIGGERAPFLALFIVWLQGTLLFFVIFCLLYLRNAMQGAIVVENVMDDVFVYLFLGGVVSIILIGFARLMLMFARKRKTV